jgi:hypothetical protein
VKPWAAMAIRRACARVSEASGEWGARDAPLVGGTRGMMPGAPERAPDRRALSSGGGREQGLLGRSRESLDPGLLAPRGAVIRLWNRQGKLDREATAGVASAFPSLVGA